MVLEVSPSMPQAAFGAKCNAKCFDYSKTGARPKGSSTMAQQQQQQQQPSWGTTSTSSNTKAMAQQQPKNKDKDTKHGAWGPVFKNKQNFLDMHLC